MTEVAKMYGGSLFELAAEEGLDEEILQQIGEVCGLFDQNPDYQRLLSMPNLPKKERCSLIDEAFRGRVQPYLLNFLKILCENGTLGELKGCAKEYRARYNEKHGIVEVRAVSAVALSEAAKQKLTAKLSAMTGKTVLLSAKVDPACIGGIRLDLDGVRLDGTVAHRLDAVRAELSSVSL